MLLSNGTDRSATVTRRHLPYAKPSIPPTGPWGEGSDWQLLAKACPAANPLTHPTSKSSGRTPAPMLLAKKDTGLGSPVCLREPSEQA